MNHILGTCSGWGVRVNNRQHRLIHLLSVEASHQESRYRAHLLIRRAVAAIVISRSDVHFIGRRKVVCTHHIQHHLHAVEVRGEPDDVRRPGVMHVGRWREQLRADDLRAVGWTLTNHHKVGSRSHRMTDVVQLSLSGVRERIIDHCWKINRTNFMPGKVPVLLSLVVQCRVCVGITVASRVAHPNVVTQVRKHIYERNLRSHEGVVS